MNEEEFESEVAERNNNLGVIFNSSKNESYLSLFAEFCASNWFLMVAVLVTVYTVATFDFEAKIINMILTLAIDGLLLGGLWFIFLGGKALDSYEKIDQGLNLLRIRYIIFQVLWWIVALFMTLGLLYLAAEIPVMGIVFLLYSAVLALFFFRLKAAKKVIKSIRQGCKENDFSEIVGLRAYTITSYIVVLISIITSLILVLFSKQIIVALYNLLRELYYDAPSLTAEELDSISKFNPSGIIFTVINNFTLIVSVVLLNRFNKIIVERSEIISEDTIIINTES